MLDSSDEWLRVCSQPAVPWHISLPWHPVTDCSKSLALTLLICPRCYEQELFEDQFRLSVLAAEGSIWLDVIYTQTRMLPDMLPNPSTHKQALTSVAMFSAVADFSGGNVMFFCFAHKEGIEERTGGTGDHSSIECFVGRAVTLSSSLMWLWSRSDELFLHRLDEMDRVFSNESNQSCSVEVCGVSRKLESLTTLDYWS